MRRSLRTLLVIALLLVALGVPVVSWFVSGSREAEREAQRVVGEAQAQARLAARTTANQLGARLEKVRASESARPYFHYQNLMHDPRGASQGLSVVPSPLAQGPIEPLIVTYFQIDPKGRVTLPTLNDDVVELNAADVGRERSLQKTLAAAAPELLRAEAPVLTSLVAQVASTREARSSHIQTARVEHRPAPPPAAIQPPAPAPLPVPSPSPAEAIPTSREPWTILRKAPPVQVDKINVGRPDGGQQSVYNSKGSQQNMKTEAAPQITAPPPEPPTQAVNIQKLDPGSFAQNAQSNAVYNELKTPAATTKTPLTKATLPPRRAPDVEITTSDLAWTSVLIGNKPSLAALRSVVRPDGGVVQGFLISEAALADAVHGAGHLTRVSGFPIGLTGWSLDVDDGVAGASARARAVEIRNTFRRTFYAGLAAAALALIAVAALVWRTERLARERAQFAAAAAHELRTPLAGLRLYGDMLAHQLGNPERSRLYAQQVSQEADRLGRVVANMLEFTRLERGSLTVKPQPGDLGGAVRECVEQLRPTLEVAGCPIQLSVDDDLPPVAFDRDAVHHIVQNLLDNAEKYSRSSIDRNVDVHVERMNGHIALTVSDRGTGIDARTARNLFHPFERGAAGDAPAGLGLGLVLVKALAEAQGGDVSWGARSDGGTTFRVLLPPFYTA